MKFNKTLAVLTRRLGKLGLKARKVAPTAAVIAGVAGVVVAGVDACVQTTKINDVVEPFAEEKEKIKEAAKEIEEKGSLKLKDGSEYTKKDNQRDLTINYVHTGMAVAKLYARPIIIGTVSIGAILFSHGVMRRRNLALAASVATISQNFTDYRGRVVERFGEQLDKELRYNIKSKEVEEIVVDEKTGEETVVKKTVQTVDAPLPSDYAKFYMQGCRGWTKSAEANKTFLLQQQKYATIKLQTQGYLFLNDVYEMLGIDKTAVGQIAGWIYNGGEEDGDGYVDFGIFDTACEANKRFVNGLENVILLDFNCDGNILDLI